MSKKKTAQVDAEKSSTEKLHDNVTAIYAKLREIRDTFREVATTFTDVKTISRDLHEVIEFSVPSEYRKGWNDDPAFLSAVDDDMYAAALIRATRNTSNVERMNALVDVAASLRNVRREILHKIDKLTDRIKLTKNETAEKNTAIALRSNAKKLLSVIDARRASIIDRVMKLRKQILSDVARATAAAATIYEGEKRGTYEEPFVDASLKYSTQTQFEDMAKIHHAATAYKKGGAK